MASTKDFLEYVLELLRTVEGITYHKMMGEYILYKDGVIFGGIYDNRFLVKKIEAIDFYDLKEEIPYPTGKPMYLVDFEDAGRIAELVNILYRNLKK